MEGLGVTIYTIIGLVIIIGILWICREIVCWYWKINDNIKLLTEIRDELKSMNRKTGEMLLNK